MRAQADGVGQLQGGAAVQGRIADDIKRATADRAVIAQDQCATVELGTTAVGVAGVEGQAARTALDQTARAADRAAQRQCIGAGDVQPAIEHHRVGQAHGRVAVQRGASCGGQHTGAEGRVVAHYQCAAVERSTAGVAVGSVEHQGAGVVFTEGAAAVEGHA
ncbi:hypothetical protein D3C73_1039680 [compost metagenome]